MSLLCVFLGILRPCDQYPSEPGVLKSQAGGVRPLSAQSSTTHQLLAKSAEASPEPEDDTHKVRSSRAAIVKLRIF